jgi:RNA polymerase sigma-70 factor (ECF subfamily)
VSAPEPAASAREAALLELYDLALPQVYGYLRARCPVTSTAEDLTAETFLAAVAAVKAGTVPDLTVAWLIGVARHKLVDHWRRHERAGRDPLPLDDVEIADDPWEERLDAAAARAVLFELGAHHRAALTLRYLDDLTVPEVAASLGRTLHATEALLVRARAAFRKAYGSRRDDG